MTFEVREVIKNGEYRELGKMEFPIQPALYYQREKKEIKKRKEKEDIKKIKKYCENEGITIDDYRQIEKKERENDELINQLSQGIIVIKNKKYKVLNYDYENYDQKKKTFKRNPKKIINITRLGGK